MKVNFLASERHYVDHLLPVYAALPDDVRGEFVFGRVPAPGGITVVSASGDNFRLGDRPSVFFEHGAGFTYGNAHSSYAGGDGKNNVVLFCNTNQQVHDANMRAYPDTPQVIVGCPKLDGWVSRGAKPTGRYPTVAFSFHWDCHVTPETRSAFPYYRQELAAISRRAREWRMLGHGHPRAWKDLAPFWKQCGIEAHRDFADVVSLADVYVCDSSSTIYEFAALDRPVVVLNQPSYRRNVRFGLRFWDDIPGIQVDHPKDLHKAIDEAALGDTWSDVRKSVTGKVYPHLGESAVTAAAAIADLAHN